MVFFGGNKKDDSDSNDGDSFYGKSLLQRNNSTPDQAIGSQMSNMNLYGNPSTSLAGSDFNTDFWNRTIGSNTNPSNKGFGQNVIGSSFPNLPSSTTRTSNNSILQPQSSRNGTAQSNNIFGANPQSSSELLNSFQNFKLLSGQSSSQQNTQQQRSVIGQMPGMQGHSSPSHSPGLGLKPPVGGGSAVSRPIGMPPVNSIGSSTPPPGPQQPNNLGFVGGQLMRSMSSGNFSQGLLSTSSGDPSIINYSTAPLTSLGNVNTKGGNAFDNDFPALANKVGNSSNSRTGQSSFSFVMSTSNKNMEGNQEFQIQNEDFPALPGANSQIQSDGMPIGLSSLSQDVNPIGHLIQHQDSKESTDSFSLGSSYEQILKDGRLMEKKSRTPVSGIQTNSSGVITNIPSGMVTDQFGMIGLLTFIRAAETEPNLVTLALGSDLTTLGLNLTSTEGLFHTFGSPFSDTTCKPHEIDFYAPHEYLISSYIRDKLAPIKLGRYGEDLLFYLYYTNCGDILQLAAAAELYARDWRYHKEERVWITRFPGMEPQMKTNTYERGTYYYFDSQGWRKVAKEFHVEYDKLEEKPTAQALQQQQQQQQQQQVL